ncbi:DUF1642 domain-containing protein [Streptococcus vicugnae]|nr:DUF1642 domain-containing protein [Streptococcus vicugnae]
MMNKQEVIDEIENAIPDFVLNDFQRGKETGLTYALELVEELDEPRKPVVPQFVADWYEEHKDDFEFNIYCLCVDFHDHPVKLDNRIRRWFSNTSNKSIQTLVAMHFFGYEVEKEKLYTVEIPNPNSPEHFVLRKNGVNKIVADCYLSNNWKLYKNTWLTESEIKKDFEWAWQFAEEVEE